tara:strand:+ start:4584 stop:6209 length:1626 start_codon:yes stop_codon:yes gene_type:complete
MNKNVIFFIIDSVRYYSTGGKDDRDKLAMMDDFEKESIYFPTTVSAAPSSIMSLSSMLTSLPAYYISRNYEDFKYDNNQFRSLHEILRKNNYQINSIFNSDELRFLFGDILNHVDKKYWPKGISAREKNWSNAALNDILYNVLNSNHLQQPFFLIVWYNVRLDPLTSELIKNGIELLKQFNIWDNSIFLMASDHGYFDPKRGFDTQSLEAQGLSHDLLMTDDCVNIPFYLRYSNCPIKKIEQQVSTLDFLPTILSLLGIQDIDCQNEIYGSDLMPLIHGDTESIKYFDSRNVRSDARFFAQSGRTTSIRNKNFKYIIRPDNNSEEFYDLIIDKWEESNQINNSAYEKEINDMRTFFNNSEQKILESQYKYLLNKLSKNVKYDKKKNLKIIVMAIGQSYYLDIISIVLKEFWGDKTKMDIIGSARIIDKMKNKDIFDSLIYTEKENVKFEHVKYDYCIKFFDSRNKDKYDTIISKIDPLIKYNSQIVLDSNMDLVRKNSATNVLFLLRTVWKKRKSYLNNPKMIISSFYNIIDIIRSKKKDH